jgi:hypothetical protein
MSCLEAQQTRVFYFDSVNQSFFFIFDAMMEAEPGLQPDFMQVANNLRVVSDHLERCRNLPAVDGGAHVAAMLQTVLNRLGDLDRKMDRVDRKVDDLGRRLIVL